MGTLEIVKFGDILATDLFHQTYQQVLLCCVYGLSHSLDNHAQLSK